MCCSCSHLLVFCSCYIGSYPAWYVSFCQWFRNRFFSLSPADIAELEDEKTDCDKKIQMLREDSERTLATILITNNFVNVTIIMLLNYVLPESWSLVLKPIGFSSLSSP